jgi:serine protease Do
MQPHQHPDPNYHLIPEVKQSSARGKRARQVWLTAMVALALVLGAYYAPLLWQSDSVNAAPGARLLPAQSLQIDSSMSQDQEALAALYEQVAPSVVSIQVTSGANTSTRGFQFPDIPGFPGLPNLPGGEAPLQRSEGSGFIYDNEGHIVTNNHVVEGAQEVNVVFYNGRWAPAEVVATDPQADLAVLKVTPPSNFDWRPLRLAQPESVKVGYTVIAMGNPFGLENTMTVGIISAMGRGLPVGQLGQSTYTLPDVIQTDAAINPGNSGGPLLNLAGEVIGVNFAIESVTRSNSGVGFTIPVSIVSRIVPALITDGKYDYAYLGLSGVSIGPDVAKQLDLTNDVYGVYVGSVVANGPSEAAGVRGGDNSVSTGSRSNLQPGGDIITAIDDQPVVRFEDLVSYLVTKAAPGQTVTLTLLRNGEEMKVDVVLGTRPGLQESARTQTEGPISARQAMNIARQAAQDVMKGAADETVVSPDTRNGQPVWVVELSNAEETATVVVSRNTGEVLEITVK